MVDVPEDARWECSALRILVGGSSAEGEPEVRLGEAEDSLEAGAECECRRDDDEEGDARGEDGWNGMRERPRLSLDEKARRIRI